MKKNNKQGYEAPKAELIELENCGVLCSSGDTNATSTQSYHLNNSAIVI